MSTPARRITAAIMALSALLVLAELVFVMTVAPHHPSPADDTIQGAVAVAFLAQSVTILTAREPPMPGGILCRLRAQSLVWKVAQTVAMVAAVALLPAFGVSIAQLATTTVAVFVF